MHFVSLLVTFALLATASSAAPRPLFAKDVVQKRQTPAVVVSGMTMIPAPMSGDGAEVVAITSIPASSSTSARPSSSTSSAAPTRSASAGVEIMASATITIPAAATATPMATVPAVVIDETGSTTDTEIIFMDGSAFMDAAVTMIDFMESQGMDTTVFREMMGVPLA